MLVAAGAGNARAGELSELIREEVAQELVAVQHEIGTELGLSEEPSTSTIVSGLDGLVSEGSKGLVEDVADTHIVDAATVQETSSVARATAESTAEGPAVETTSTVTANAVAKASVVSNETAGPPEKVEPCWPGRSIPAIDSPISTAPRGSPPASGLARVTMSGTTPYASWA